MSKKILIFSTAYFPFIGGAEVSIKEITDRIPQIEFDMITAKMKKGLPFKERIGNVNVYRLGVGIPIIDKLILPFEGALFVKHLSKKNKYSAYWCVMASFASGAAYVANIFSRKKTPIILNLQEGDSEEHLSKRWFGLINISWKMALKYADKVTVLSKSLKERALRFGYKGVVCIIPNGVDVERFDIKIDLEKKENIRKNWGIKNNETVLITSSRLSHKNGIADVIKALPSIEVKFVVCGEGELLEGLKKIASDNGVTEKIIFLGNVSHTDLPKYLKASDIFIRPSLSEGFGLSFIEAMAARLPVITTPVGGIVDFLEDGVTGYFCKPGDPGSIALTVRRVIDDIGTNRIVDNAYRMILKKYDWALISDEMVKVFSIYG